MTSDTTTSENYELTPVISQFLDSHLVLPLLDFVETLGHYTQETVQKARLQALEPTNMVDFYNELHRDLYGEDTVDGMKPRDPVVERLKTLQSSCQRLLNVITDKKVVNDLRERHSLTADTLRIHYDVEEREIEALYEFAKLTFDCGRYHDAAEYLFMYRVLSNDEHRCFLALWGQLAADILLTHWDDALEGLNQLGEAIDAMSSLPHLLQIRYRTWLIHWGLFVFFNHDNGRSCLIEFLTKERYMNAVQTSCPHILRYLTTAIIINQRRRNVLSDLVKVVQKLKYVYSDPITMFLKSVYHDFDFDSALEMLRQCETVLSNDFFLLYIKDDFIESARVFFFETYCRVHNTISVDMVAETIGANNEDAERWIVDLIRNAGLDARIDSHANHVIMARDYPSVYQQIIDKTKSLTFRTNQLVGLVDKKYLSRQEA